MNRRFRRRRPPRTSATAPAIRPIFRALRRRPLRGCGHGCVLGRHPHPRVLGSGRARRWDLRDGPGRQRRGGSRVRSLRGARRDVDLSGGRRSADAAAAAESLRRAFADGHLRRGSPRRARWGSHFVAVTTAGTWSMVARERRRRSRGGGGVGFRCQRLGGAATRATVRDARARAGATVGDRHPRRVRPGGVRSRAWADAGGSAKERARWRSRREMSRHRRVVPPLIRGDRSGADRGGSGTGSGSGVDSDARVTWRSPWTSWGGEPWFGVPDWAAEETRVSRPRVDARDLRAAFLGRPDAFAGAGDVAEEGEDGASSGVRVDLHATAKTLLAYVSAKYTAARWCPGARLRDAYRTMTDEELGLIDAAESLVVESASTGRARAAAELVAAGAVEHLARRVRSLLTPRATSRRRRPRSRNPRGSNRSEGALAGARVVDDSKRRRAPRGGGAGGVAVDAVVRAFLAGWKGNLGTRPAPEVEACVEELANADLANAEVRIFAPVADAAAKAYDAPGADDAEDAEDAATSGSASPSTSTSPSPSPWPRRRPSPASRQTGRTSPPRRARKPPRAGACTFSRLALRIETSLRVDSSSGSSRASAASRRSVVDADGRRGRDGEVDDVRAVGRKRRRERRGDGHRRTHRASVTLAQDDAGRRLMREDPMAQGGGDSGGDDGECFENPESPMHGVRGAGVAVFLAKDGDWSAHDAMVKQAPRLAHLAQSRGAVGVIFLWPDRTPGDPVQPPPRQPQLRHRARDPRRDASPRAISTRYPRRPPRGGSRPSRPRGGIDGDGGASMRRRVGGGVRVSTGRGGGGRERQSEFGRGTRRGVGEDARQGGGGETRGGGGCGGGGGARAPGESKYGGEGRFGGGGRRRGGEGRRRGRMVVEQIPRSRRRRRRRRREGGRGHGRDGEGYRDGGDRERGRDGRRGKDRG